MEVLLVIGGTILFCFLVSLIVGIVGNRIDYPGDVAKIEQLRRDYVKIADTERAIVVGQMTKWNQTIAEMQKYNKIWWSCVFISNGWDKIEKLCFKM